jgi:chromosome segregation ATPase
VPCGPSVACHGTLLSLKNSDQLLAAMSIKGFVTVVGGVVVVGGGIYYSITLERLAGLEYAEKEVGRHAAQQRKKIDSITSQSQEQQALVASLQQQAEVARRSSAQLRTSLESARREVQLLEQQLADKESGLKTIFLDAKRAQDMIESLGRERLKAREAVSAYEKDLADVRSRVAEAKAQLNPLNHPAVKDLLSQMRKP